jgi:hypothetical protein
MGSLFTNWSSWFLRVFWSHNAYQMQFIALINNKEEKIWIDNYVI